MFGGSLGFVYSPSSFTAKVGDTVRWEGALALTAQFNDNSSGRGKLDFDVGSTFMYVIKVVGLIIFM